jgi:arylsulfatase A-like enzyme
MNTTRPNILLIITDQQSRTMMSCAGNTYLKTPSMDAIAERGVRFTRAYATNPVCVPSRYSLMTGKMPSAIGMKSNTRLGVDPWSQTEIDESLGNVLTNAGYTCHYGGKVHLPLNMNPDQLGYSVFADGDSGEREELGPKTAEILRGDHEKPWFITASFINPHDICHHAINEHGTSKLSRILQEKCVIESENVAKAVSSFDPERCPPLPENHQPQENEPEAVRRLVESRPFRQAIRDKWTETDWRKHRWAYLRLTESVDTDIAPIIEALDETGAWDNTVVIFTSDHGDHDSAHKLEHKTVLYREAAEIPFIVADPSGRKNEVEKTVVSNGLDIYTTLCDYAGIDPPSTRDGISLRNLITSGEKPTRDAVPLECELGTGIATGDHIYALYDFGADREQLYDIEKDPGQTRNHAEDPENQELLLKLRKKHRKIIRSTKVNV